MGYEGRCVRCGKCKGVCPTYNLAKREDFSPRGRVYVSEVLSSSLDKRDTSFKVALDSCFFCGACEDICPQRVNIREIIVEGRKRLINFGDRFLVFPLKSVANKPKIKRFGINANVALYPGCLISNLRRDWIYNFTRIMLHIFGSFDLIEGVCCGFPYISKGFDYSFSEGLLNDYELVVSLCSTCSSELRKRLGSNVRVLDSIEFVRDYFEIFSRRIAFKGSFSFHYPCHLIRGLMSIDAIDDLLVTLGNFVPIPQNCCGFGCGFLKDLAFRSSLVTINSAISKEVTTLFTTCPACYLQLTASNLRAHSNLKITHIVDLFSL